MVGDKVVKARDWLCGGWSRDWGVRERDIAFGFPHGQRGFRDVPRAGEPGCGGRLERGRLGKVS